MKKIILSCLILLAAFTGAFAQPPMTLTIVNNASCGINCSVGGHEGSGGTYTSCAALTSTTFMVSGNGGQFGPITIGSSIFSSTCPMGSLYWIGCISPGSLVVSGSGWDYVDVGASCGVVVGDTGCGYSNSGTEYCCTAWGGSVTWSGTSSAVTVTIW